MLQVYNIFVSVLSMGLSNTLNRLSNRPQSRYSSDHHHENPTNPSMNLQMNHPSMDLIASRALANTLPATNSRFTFEPNFPSHHNHSHGQKSTQQQHSMPSSGGLPSSCPMNMSLRSNSSKLLYRNSDDLLSAYPNSPIESSGTFPRNREPQRIRIPSNQSVTSRSSAEKFELRNSPMPYHIEVIFTIFLDA